MRTTKKARVFKPIKVEDIVYDVVKKLAQVRGVSMGAIIKSFVLNTNTDEK